MKIITMLSVVCAAAVAYSSDIQLPPPETGGGMSLMEALSLRKSGRGFSARDLSEQTLSSLLWAANGINRPAEGRRTAPTGMNVQDIDVYVMTPSGVYIHDAKANVLKLVNPGDHRAAAGKQSFAQEAKLNLFYVHDSNRAMKLNSQDPLIYAGIHAGAIMQNVYLFCAKAGLVTVARAYIDYDACSKALKLEPNQRIVLGQTVGYPPSAEGVGRDGAVRAALSHASLREQDVRRLKCKLDREDGVLVYEVEFECGGYEYDYEIDAASGRVLKFEKDRD